MLGLFDSGIGGLTVVKELLRRVPKASFVYLGDTARTPYGNKTPEILKRYALENAEFLISHGATSIAVACNTISAVAMDVLREKFPQTTFFDVVTPAANSVTNTTKIGVIGTRATIASGIYERVIKSLNPKAKVFSKACPLFVPLAEEGWMGRAETKRIVRYELRPLIQQQIEALILGCTHYPLLIKEVRACLHKRTKIIDSPAAILDDIQRSAPGLLSQSDAPKQEYYFSDPSPRTDEIATRWLGTTVRGKAALLN